MAKRKSRENLDLFLRSMETFRAGIEPFAKQRNEQEAEKRQSELSAEFANPETTPIRKAQIAPLLGPEFQKQWLKGMQQQQQLADIQARFGGQGGAPQGGPQAGPQMQQQMPEQQQGSQLANYLQSQGRLPGPQMAPNIQGPQAGQTPQFSPQEILQTTAINPAIGRAEADINKMQQRQQQIQQQTFESERDYATKITDDFRKRMSGITQAIPIKNLALQLADQAIESGDVGAFSGAHLAQLTGLPIFQSASGAGLSLAAKDNLVGNLTRVSARAQNQWIEQVMSGAFPRAGQSRQANGVVAEGVRAAKELDEVEAQVYGQLSEQDNKTLGYIGKDIEARVHKAVKPLQQQILDRTSYRTRQYWEQEKSDKQLISLTSKPPPRGTIMTRKMMQVFIHKYKDPEKAVKHAKELGYRIPTNEEADEWGL